MSRTKKKRGKFETTNSHPQHSKKQRTGGASNVQPTSSSAGGAPNDNLAQPVAAARPCATVDDHPQDAPAHPAEGSQAREAHVAPHRPRPQSATQQAQRTQPGSAGLSLAPDCGGPSTGEQPGMSGGGGAHAAVPGGTEEPGAGLPRAVQAQQCTDAFNHLQSLLQTRMQAALDAEARVNAGIASLNQERARLKQVQDQLDARAKKLAKREQKVATAKAELNKKQETLGRLHADISQQYNVLVNAAPALEQRMADARHQAAVMREALLQAQQVAQFAHGPTGDRTMEHRRQPSLQQPAPAAHGSAQGVQHCPPSAPGGLLSSAPADAAPVTSAEVANADAGTHVSAAAGGGQAPLPSTTSAAGASSLQEAAQREGTAPGLDASDLDAAGATSAPERRPADHSAANEPEPVQRVLDMLAPLLNPGASAAPEQAAPARAEHAGHAGSEHPGPACSERAGDAASAQPAPASPPAAAAQTSRCGSGQRSKGQMRALSPELVHYSRDAAGTLASPPSEPDRQPPQEPAAASLASADGRLGDQLFKFMDSSAQHHFAAAHAAHAENPPAGRGTESSPAHAVHKQPAGHAGEAAIPAPAQLAQPAPAAAAAARSGIPGLAANLSPAPSCDAAPAEHFCTQPADFPGQGQAPQAAAQHGAWQPQHMQQLAGLDHQDMAASHWQAPVSQHPQPHPPPAGHEMPQPSWRAGHETWHAAPYARRAAVPAGHAGPAQFGHPGQHEHSQHWQQAAQFQHHGSQGQHTQHPWHPQQPPQAPWQDGQDGGYPAPYGQPYGQHLPPPLPPDPHADQQWQHMQDAGHGHEHWQQAPGAGHAHAASPGRNAHLRQDDHGSVSLPVPPRPPQQWPYPGQLSGHGGQHAKPLPAAPPPVQHGSGGPQAASSAQQHGQAAANEHAHPGGRGPPNTCTGQHGNYRGPLSAGSAADGFRHGVSRPDAHQGQGQKAQKRKRSNQDEVKPKQGAKQRAGSAEHAERAHHPAAQHQYPGHMGPSVNGSMHNRQLGSWQHMSAPAQPGSGAHRPPRKEFAAGGGQPASNQAGDPTLQRPFGGSFPTFDASGRQLASSQPGDPTQQRPAGSSFPGRGLAGRRGRGGRGRGRGGGGAELASPDGDLDAAVSLLRSENADATAARQSPDAAQPAVHIGGDREVPRHPGQPQAQDAAAAHASHQRALGEAQQGSTRSTAVDRRRAAPSGHSVVAAQQAMQTDAPELLELLQQQQLVTGDMRLLPAPAADANAGPGSSPHADASAVESAANPQLYKQMCAILERVCHRQAEPWDKTRFTHVENNRKVAYCLDALQCLVERAQAYGERGQPVEWGWCRELKSFVFVFEPANRLAVEKPEYGHATYFFDLEEPMLVSAQVQRLVGVLSVRGVTRMALLDDTTLDLAAKLTDEEKAVLEKCGWTSPCGIRSLVNFSGERIYHREPTGTATDHGDKADYREKISRMLARGAAGGRITKQRPA